MSRVYDREEVHTWPDMGERRCIVCGSYPVNHHHIPPIGSGRRGSWQGALLALCGSGTTGCHGLWHHGDLELRFMDGRWMWRGMDSRGLFARRWTPCHDDAWWMDQDEIDWLQSQV